MKILKKCATFLLCAFMIINSTSQHTLVYAENENDTQVSEAYDPALWPDGPTVNSGSAILIEANTGTVLYEKNAHERNYPASITKIMTALLGIENCNMDDVITFSKNAVYSVDPFEDAHISLDVGEQLTVEQTLHAILIKSANEASYGLAEYVSGSVDEFANLMNERAKELGALGTHFTNASGLEDDNHYTTAYDMAMIGRACFENDKFMSIISLPTTYVVPETNLKDEKRYFYNKYKLLPGREKEYAYSLGGKPGWTTISGNTLVSFAEKDGVRLIVCVMKSTLVDIYDDTVNLFEYGFNNYQKINISENETKYTVPQATFFNTTSELFEHTHIDLMIDKDAYIILPNNVSFADAKSTITYNTSDDTTNSIQNIATINYTYNGVNVGSANLILNSSTKGAFDFSKEENPTDSNITNKSYLQINIKLIVILIIVLAFLILIIGYNYALIQKRKRTKRHYKRKRRRHNHYR